MFKCEKCAQQISANLPSFLFPIERRKKVYPERYLKPKGRACNGGKPNAAHNAESSKKKNFDKGGVGFETVREIKVCEVCYEDLTAQMQMP